jgi:hypothetical protein
MEVMVMVLLDMGPTTIERLLTSSACRPIVFGKERCSGAPRDVSHHHGIRHHQLGEQPQPELYVPFLRTLKHSVLGQLKTINKGMSFNMFGDREVTQNNHINKAHLVIYLRDSMNVFSN